jgi:hypothetical protein
MLDTWLGEFGICIETYIGDIDTCLAHCLRSIIDVMVLDFFISYVTCFMTSLRHIMNDMVYGWGTSHGTWFMAYILAHSLRSILDIGHMVWDLLWYMFTCLRHILVHGLWMLWNMMRCMVDGCYGIFFSTWLMDVMTHIY